MFDCILHFFKNKNKTKAKKLVSKRTKFVCDVPIVINNAEVRYTYFSKYKTCFRFPRNYIHPYSFNYYDDGLRWGKTEINGKNKYHVTAFGYNCGYCTSPLLFNIHGPGLRERLSF